MFMGKRTFAVILILTAVLGAPVRALGADTSYVEHYEKWNDSDKVQVILTELDGFSGCLQYFYEDNCFYGHISYDEDSLTNHNNIIQVEVEVDNENRNYNIIIQDEIENSDEYCKVYKSFTPDIKYGQDIYFIIEFNQKEDKNIVNSLSVQISVNSHEYMLAENIDVGGSSENSYAEDNKTLNNKTTRKSEEEDGENDNQSQTKFHYEAQEAANDQRSADSVGDGSGEKEKFSAGSVQSGSGQAASQKSATQEQENSDDSVTQKKSSFSTGAKAMLAGSGVIGVTGVALIVKSIISQAIEKEAQKRAVEVISKAKQENVPDEE